MTAFGNALDTQRCPSLDDCIRALVDLAFAPDHVTPERHRCVIELAPRLGVADRPEVVRQATVGIIEAALGRYPADIAPEIDLATASILIATTLEALAHRAVQMQATRSQIESLAMETTRLVTRYLTPRN
ncbi:hypothetical protein LFL96_24240 [Paraburkholderia sp. D15]|uniref:hypothetical protein n=1 Tax=Paraburkholderia sp. D15 TaxID=2880218 RepID=UPI0024786C04|nr:hypothetical protein [Paraburkholderia sp. D15]WGS54761.1 hypothetical protein LFL96_24240 [Paraburkholderia sp. D15]